MFGGLPATAPEGMSAYGDMWVLTIPGFQWFKADAVVEGRAWTACAAYGRQLIVVGGNAERSLESWTVEQRDPWPQGIGVFDLSAFKWSAAYDPEAGEYESPQMIQNWYNQG